MLFAVSLAVTGCKTVYSDTYSPRRNRFVPPTPKPVKVDVLPPIEGVPGSGSAGPAADAFTMPPPASGAPALPSDPGAGAMVPPVPGL